MVIHLFTHHEASMFLIDKANNAIETPAQKKLETHISFIKIQKNC